MVEIRHNSFFCDNFDTSSGGCEGDADAKKLPMLAKASAADDSVSLTLSDSIAKFEARAPSLLLAASWERSEGHAHTTYQKIMRS
jgi:hypothetical protein